MKKIFIEPEIVRIDLKMTENIASSSSTDGLKPWDYEFGFGLWVTTSVGNLFECTEFIFDTHLAPPPRGEVLFEDAMKAYNLGCFRYA